MNIPSNIVNMRHTIAHYEKMFARPANSVRLMLATKSRSIQEMQLALQAGACIFGENYLQEALPKMETLGRGAAEWHFIGSIQKNKTRKIAASFDWVHSVASLDIAERLHAQRPSSLPVLNICLEVNVSHEASKAGLNYDETQRLAAQCMSLPKLKLRGLMAIPARYAEFIDQRAEFYKLRLLFNMLNEKNFNLDTLSMGTTADMPAAIAEGSTMVRIGTAIFKGAGK